MILNKLCNKIYVQILYLLVNKKLFCISLRLFSSENILILERAYLLKILSLGHFSHFFMLLFLKIQHLFVKHLGLGLSEILPCGFLVIGILRIKLDTLLLTGFLLILFHQTLENFSFPGALCHNNVSATNRQ